jgi:thioredoxin 1
MTTPYDSTQPERAQVDAWPGIVALDFGTNWCGYCQAAAGPIGAALRAHAQVRHVKVEDGPGRPLGRSFRVKLWPTVIVLKDGAELGRVVRPGHADELTVLLEQALA